ncbi:FecR family protein [Gabonibacter chumensis]|uniref:FecR family protein n=1 Tax=Gabonibacter chumensis TaxID=2972474 RepID=UPI0025732BB4|nr:FecR family protein [Gabonibacter chumensis]MCR9011872.1 FecR family protein [Gabonibacter chumensis]
MKKTKLDCETEDWLIAFFNGELNADEESEVGVWLEKEQENQEAYEALMQDYLHVRWSLEHLHIREKHAREKIFSSLRKKRNPWIYYSVAASVAILLAVTAVLFVNREQREPRVEIAIAKIRPVHPQAVLVLSTGVKVDLTEESWKIIQERDGSTVKVDSDRGICYDSCGEMKQSELIYNKIIVPRGGEYFVTLSEGTKIWLDAESELEYPVFFTGNNREVRLKGNAYFSVTKDTDKPFVVQVGSFSLRVYGTEFNVNAYNPRQIETVLVEGSIGLKANAFTSEQIMKPNDLALSNPGTGQSEIRQTDIYPYIAWKNQEIVFADERLETIMEKLARWYDVAVFFRNESLKELRFDCNMRRYADINDLFFFMEKTSGARFTLNGRTVVVSKK